MKRWILTGLLLCVMALSGCMLAEPTKKTSKEQKVAMQTEAGREAYIAEELYEGAEILSEIKNEETGFIVSEFMSGDYHSFVFFRPTEKGYAYNGEADDTLDGMVTVAYAPMGDGDYHVFLRHSEDIVSLDVTYFDAKTNKVLQNETVTFADGNLTLMLRDEKINHWGERIVAHDQGGQEYVLRDWEPLSPEELEKIEKEKDRQTVMKLIIYVAVIAAVHMIGKIRRKK